MMGADRHATPLDRHPGFLTIWLAMDELAYYATPGRMTLLPDDSRLASFPSDIAGIVGTLEGLMMHRVEADRRGIEVTEERRGEEQLRAASGRGARLIELDPAPL